MKRYDSYKDSGVEWIGEIPSSWVKTKLKYKLQEVVTGGTPDTSNDSFWSDEDNGINWISISDITSNGREITETKKFISEKGLESKKLKILPIGSLIYSIYGSIGKISRLRIPSTVHQGILGLSTNSTYDTTFLEYYLIYFKEYVSLFSSSNTQENLNQEKVSNFDIPVPPLSEQQQIVSFLDTKTSLIDSLIEKTQRKIELLKEKRTSLINEVVTKGLNPNVEMKDSGIEWIGEIPSHWRTSKLGFYTTKIGSGSTPRGGSEVYVDSGIPFIRSQNVHFDGLKMENISHIEPETHLSMKGSTVIKDDVLLNITGGSIGRCCVVNIEGEMNTNQHVSIIRTTKNLQNIFLNYILNSDVGQSQVVYNISGGNREGLTIEGIRDFRITLPPLNEQQQIVEYLDEQTQLIDKTISIEEKRIELLKEYRQSLISEVVTGKRKVVE